MNREPPHCPTCECHRVPDLIATLEIISTWVAPPELPQAVREMAANALERFRGSGSADAQ